TASVNQPQINNEHRLTSPSRGRIATGTSDNFKRRQLIEPDGLTPVGFICVYLCSSVVDLILILICVHLRLLRTTHRPPAVSHAFPVSVHLRLPEPGCCRSARAPRAPPAHAPRRESHRKPARRARRRARGRRACALPTPARRPSAAPARNAPARDSGPARAARPARDCRGFRGACVRRRPKG